jgi:hypothetical protein
VDSSVQTTSPAGPARYIPAAALMGVSRTMVYVRLPGAKQVGVHGHVHGYGVTTHGAVGCTAC